MKCLSVIPMSECRGSGTGTWIKVKSPSNIDFDIMVDLHQRISVYKYCAHIGRLELFWLTRLCVDQLSFCKSNITLVSLVRNNWTCFFMCLSPTQKKKNADFTFLLDVKWHLFATECMCSNLCRMEFVVRCIQWVWLIIHMCCVLFALLLQATAFGLWCLIWLEDRVFTSWSPPIQKALRSLLLLHYFVKLLKHLFIFMLMAISIEMWR